MLDVSLFRQPAFLGVQLATFCIGAGMFALFPYLSIYLQDIDRNSPLGAGLRFLPITVFVFFVPLLTRKVAARVPTVAAALGAAWRWSPRGLFLLEVVSVGSNWTVLLPGFIVCGIGIGLANPTIAGAALRVVDPARTGMASGISNTCRIGGLAIGVAVFGVVLQQRVGNHLAAAGYPGKSIAAAVSSSGIRAAAGRPALVPIANAAFVSGFRLMLLVGGLTVLVGACAGLLVRRRQQPVADPGLNTGRLGAPAGRVRRARDLRVRARADDRAELDLHVPLDHRLRRAAAFLAPDERHLGAELDVGVDDRQREHRALVVRVAGEGRDADQRAVVQHLVVRPRRVVRQWQVDVLGRGALVEERAERARDVLAVPRQRDLPPRGRLGQLLERVAADEVVVELHERPVAEIPRVR